MRTYQAKNSNGMGKRVRKVQGKARFVGLLYLLGALGLAVLACMPMLTFDGKPLGITSFYKPYLDLFGENKNVFSVIIATLYLFVVLSAVINALRCLGKLGDLTQNNSRQMGRYNKTMQAMDEMGRLFSGSFAAIVIFHFLIWMFVGNSAEIALVMPFAYITLAVGLAIHFLAGLLHGKVHYFQVGGHVANVVEVKRECGLFVYFFRNLIQIAATAGILYYLAANSLLNPIVKSLAAFKSPIEGMELIPSIVCRVLQIFMVIFAIVLIKHATATTEFNLEGMEGKGMRNYRVFSFLTFLMAIGFIVVHVLKADFKEVLNANLDYVIIAGIALVAFLVDCIFVSRKKKAKEEEKEDEPVFGDDFAPMAPVANAPVPQMPVVPMPMMPACQRQMANGQPVFQPIYIPVYYPYPMPTPYPMPAPAPAPYSAAPASSAALAPAADKNARPAPAPAPSYLKPTPAPESVKVESKNELRKKRRELKNRKKDLKRAKIEAKKNAKLAKKNKKEESKVSKKEDVFAKKNAAVATDFTATTAMQMPAPAPAPQKVVEAPAKPVENEVKELSAALDPKKEWQVRCPKCGKLLLIRETTPYHRCPSCDKVFQIRKFETFVKKD